jgi:hypothetical protein
MADHDMPDLPEIPDTGDFDDMQFDPPQDPGGADPIVPPVEPSQPAPGSGLDDLGGLDLDAIDDFRAPEPVHPHLPPAGDAPGAPGGTPDGAPPGAPDIDAPSVDLDLDEPLGSGGLPDIGSDEAQVPEVDLSLDPTDGTDLGDQAEPDDPLEFDQPPDGVELPGGLDLPFADANAWLTPGLVVAGAVAIGIAIPAALSRKRSAPVDFAAHLDELGIDARVEHLDLTGLEELLDEGRSVLLSTDGTAGVDADAVMSLRSVDRDAGRVHVADDLGTAYAVPLDRFEDAWADSANQVVTAANGEGRIALVPVVLERSDLALLT